MTSASLAALWPKPQRIEPGSGHLSLPRGEPLRALVPSGLQAALRLSLGPGLEAAGCDLQIDGPGSPARQLQVLLDPELVPQGYMLELKGTGIWLRAADPAGLRFGARTLGQLLRAAAQDPGPLLQLPCLRIEDAPAFATRGLMLDISRDRVPTLQELKARIEVAAEFKFNHLQLYTEHSFAYAGHETVWGQASPLTAEEVRELDAFAGERGIELCPNQNSFGHMHRWLRQPAYAHLAEAPEGIVHAFSPTPEPFGLCPVDPGSLDLCAELYDQLLPCFGSRRFNVGLDETLDLGLGRSAAACAEHGKGQVYLDYLLAIHRLVEERDHQMLYWADIALGYPELHAQLPRGATPIVWGYEDGHPFEEQVGALARAGLDPWVCPGTSSWQGFTGRIDNALANLQQAAQAGLEHGCEGYLVSDWGDYGHWQPQPIALPGIVLGAAQAWNPSAEQEDPTEPLNLHVLRDPSGASGRALVALGRAYRALGSGAVNGVATFFHLRYAHDPLPVKMAPGLTPAGCAGYQAALAEALEELAGAQPAGQGAGLVLEELRWAARAGHWSAERAAARRPLPPGSSLSEVPRPKARELQSELALLIEQGRPLWLSRCRPGGQADSIEKLARVGRLLDGAL